MIARERRFLLLFLAELVIVAPATSLLRSERLYYDGVRWIHELVINPVANEEESGGSDDMKPRMLAQGGPGNDQADGKSASMMLAQDHHVYSRRISNAVREHPLLTERITREQSSVFQAQRLDAHYGIKHGTVIWTSRSSSG